MKIEGQIPAFVTATCAGARSVSRFITLPATLHEECLCYFTDKPIRCQWIKEDYEFLNFNVLQSVGTTQRTSAVYWGLSFRFKAFGKHEAEPDYASHDDSPTFSKTVLLEGGIARLIPVLGAALLAWLALGYNSINFLNKVQARHKFAFGVVNIHKESDLWLFYQGTTVQE